MKILTRFFGALKNYKAIKADESKKATSKYYARRTIIYSILSTAFSTTCFIIGQFGITDNVFLSVMLLTVLALMAYVLPLIMLFYAFTYLVVQFSLNSRSATWLALIVFLLAASGTAYIIISTI